jgi:putative transferase (TIGR04331 family)
VDAAAAVAAFEDAYVERAREALGDRLRLADAAVLDRRALVTGGKALAGWWAPRDGGERLAVLPNPWDERSAIADHEAYCWAASEALLGRLAPALDEHHGVERGREYWDLLLRSWMGYVISAALDRRLYCATVSRLRPELPFVAGPADTQVTAPEHMVAAIELIRTDAGNRAFSAGIARSLGLRLAAAEQEEAVSGRGEPPAPASLPERVLTAAQGAGGAAARRIVSTRRGRRVALVGSAGMSGPDLLRLCRRVRGLRLAAGAAQASQGEPEDRGARERLAALPEEDERLATIAAAACRLLPRTVLEDYGTLVERSRAVYGPACPALAANYGPHDAENEFLARCAAAGLPLAFAQHGGTYLQARVNAQERLELRPGSTFVSWGGTGDGILPLPSPYLARLRDGHRGGDSVVLIEWLMPPDPYPFAFTSYPLANQSYEQSALLPRFVRAVDTARGKLFLKRYPAFVEGAERDPALAALPHRPPPTRRSASRLMAAARLAVVTYPDTPFIEAMVLGVPTVGLWDPSLWELRDDAQAPFDALRHAGVLFSDPEEAAAHVDRVYEHAGEWWGSADIQAARRAFLERFAIGGRWLDGWASFLRELRDGARGP